jgi:hypothetical protein
MTANRLWLTNAFSADPSASGKSAASKQGLPSQRANHKSDSGPPQCLQPAVAILSCSGDEEASCFASRRGTKVTSLNFFKDFW